MSLGAVKYVTELKSRRQEPKDEMKDRLTASEYGLLMFLASCALEKNGHVCEFRIEELAEMFGCSRQNIHRLLLKPKRLGYLSIDSGLGRGNTNIFSFPKLPEKCKQEVTLSPENVNINALKCKPELHPPYIDQQSSTDDEDDAFVRLRDAFAEISQRVPTEGEIGELRKNARDEEGCAAVRSTLDTLRTRWNMPDFLSRNDATNWLKKTIKSRRGNHSRTRGTNRSAQRTISNPKDYAYPRQVQGEHLSTDLAAVAPDWTERESPGWVQNAQMAPTSNHTTNAATPHEELWKKTLGELQLQLATGTFTSWLQNTSAIASEGKTIVVEAPNQYSRDWLENRLKGMVCRTLKIINKEFTEVQFVCSHAQSGMH